MWAEVLPQCLKQKLRCFFAETAGSVSGLSRRRGADARVRGLKFTAGSPRLQGAPGASQSNPGYMSPPWENTGARRSVRPSPGAESPRHRGLALSAAGERGAVFGGGVWGASRCLSEAAEGQRPGGGRGDRTGTGAGDRGHKQEVKGSRTKFSSQKGAL